MGREMKNKCLFGTYSNKECAFFSARLAPDKTEWMCRFILGFAAPKALYCHCASPMSVFASFTQPFFFSTSLKFIVVNKLVLTVHSGTDTIHQVFSKQRIPRLAYSFTSLVKDPVEYAV